MGVPSLFLRNDTVWKQIRYLLLGSTSIFLITIFFGFVNALTVGDLPRWQVLIHLHSGSIGWITLSIIALAIWIFGAQNNLSEQLVGRLQTFTWVILVAFTGYVISFGVAFSQQDGFFVLLPIFGIVAAGSIWSAAAFTVRQFRHSAVKTEAQLMVMSALLVASLGALMGLLLGLENALETEIIPGADRIGSHAGVMDGYLLLAASAMVGWFLGRNENVRFSRGALVQCLSFILAPLAVWLGIIFSQEMLAGLSAPFVIIGVILFAVRNGRKVLNLNPLKSGPEGWFFFGAIWTVIWGILFAYVIVIFIREGIEGISPALGVLFAHAAFVGTMTNLILGICSVRSQNAGQVFSWAEPAGLWLTNLGIVVFVAVKFAADSRAGAFVMGIGVLLGVGAMIARFLSERADVIPVSSAD